MRWDAEICDPLGLLGRGLDNFVKILSQAQGKRFIKQVTVVKVLILLPGSLSGPDSEEWVPDNGIKQIPETGGRGKCPVQWPVSVSDGISGIYRCH